MVQNVQTTQSEQIDRQRGYNIEQFRAAVPANDEKKIRGMLAVASVEFHLVSPATAGRPPEGCELVFSPVIVDVDAETYALPGSENRGLSKVALDKIAAAAGVSWVPGESRRLDDGSDPRYCHFRAVGRYRHFDGTVSQIVGEKEMDLRDGSPAIESIIVKSAKKAKREAEQKKKPITEAEARRIGEDKAANQISEMRLHILSHAETKARLRATRSLGLRTSYSPAELQRPFVVVRVSFTGRTDDPELKREFARAISQNFLNGHAALYGAAATALPAPAQVMSPPPVGRASRVTDSDEHFLDIVEEPTPAPHPSASAAPAPPPAEKAPDASSSSEQPDAGDEPAIRFGSAKGIPLRDAEDDDLAWYAGALAKSVADPEKARFKNSNERELALVRAEQKRRRGEDDGY